MKLALGFFAFLYLLNGYVVARLLRRGDSLMSCLEYIGWVFFWPIMLLLYTDERK